MWWLAPSTSSASLLAPAGPASDLNGSDGRPSPGPATAELTNQMTGPLTLTVTVNVSGPVIWFVNSAVAGPGDGRPSDPFKSLAGPAGASNDADDVDGANHHIFLYSGGTYTGGLTLNSGETL